MSLYLRQLEVGPMQNFIYLVGDSEARQCWVVDPAWDMQSVKEAARQDGFQIAGALLTHSHYDHCNALDQLLKEKDMPVYVQKRELEVNEKAVQTGIFGFLPRESVKMVSHGEVLSLGATRLTVLHTPGHTPGSQCFLVENRLIAGDTLFIGTCGRCDLPGGNPYEMFESLHNVIGKLPADTVLFPGHDYSAEGKQSTLGLEKTRNKYLGAGSLDSFLEMTGLG